MLTLTNFVCLLKSFFCNFYFCLYLQVSREASFEETKILTRCSIQNEKGWKKGSSMTSFLDDLKKVINHYSGRAADWKCFVQSTTVTRIRRRWVQEGGGEGGFRNKQILSFVFASHNSCNSVVRCVRLCCWRGKSTLFFVAQMLLSSECFIVTQVLKTHFSGVGEGLKEVRGQSLSTPFFVVHLLSPSCKQVKFEMVFVAASFTYLLLHPRRHMCLPFEAKEWFINI